MSAFVRKIKGMDQVAGGGGLKPRAPPQPHPLSRRLEIEVTARQDAYFHGANQNGDNQWS